MSPDQYERTRQVLLGPDSDAVLDLVVTLFLHGWSAVHEGKAVSHVRELGFVTGDPLRLTRLGYLVADSMREYVFWRQRDGQMHCEGRVPHLSSAYYEGKSVLEIGCGSGCNLMSLVPLAGRLVGIEPVGVYRQMSAIFCERSGLAPVQIRPGCGEAIPFPDGQFDLVLSISAHQYMDVRPALAEMTRVLAPGGELQIVGGTLVTYVVQGLKPIARGSLSGLKTFCVTLVNTMSYSAIQRRAIGSRSGATTAFPVYPPKRQMDRWLRSCGLRELRPATRAYPETCFSYSKPR